LDNRVIVELRATADRELQDAKEDKESAIAMVKAQLTQALGNNDVVSIFRASGVMSNCVIVELRATADRELHDVKDAAEQDKESSIALLKVQLLQALGMSDIYMLLRQRTWICSC